MLSFLLSPIGKYASYAVGILLVIGVVFGWYELKISEAKKDALATFNLKQLEQVVKEQDNLIAQMKMLKSQEDILTEKTNQLNDDVQNRVGKAEIIIQNSKDKTLDPIFNQILKQLRGNK